MGHTPYVFFFGKLQVAELQDSKIISQKLTTKKVFIGIIADIAVIVGFACIVYGSYCIYKPAGFIVAGAMLLFAFSPLNLRFNNGNNK